jgi:integrase
MAGRRGHGEDAVYRDGDRWRGAVSLGVGPNGRRLRRKVSGRTKAEVLQKLRELRKTVDAGLPVPDNRITVGAYLDRWLSTTLPGHIADSTLDDYQDTVRLHLTPTLGTRRLSSLTVADVDELWAIKRAAGYSANSIRIMRAVLRKALGQAEREGLIVRNVAALSSAPRLTPKEGRSLTIEQAQKLLQVVRGHRLEALVLITLAFGLRRGEALGLRWDGVDWGVGSIAVTHSVKRVRARDAKRRTAIVLGELKTRRSRRTLYLTPELLAVLRRHRVRQLEEQLRLGAAWQEWGLMFPSEVGTPLDPDSFSHLFSRWCREAGLGHWHPHELRHSAASLMLAQGTPLYVVSEVLGHASIAVTKDVYGHLIEGDKRAATAAMSAALLSPSRQAEQLAPRLAPKPPQEG